MYDNISTAHAVSNWNSLGVKLPEELAVAVEVFEALRWVETGHAVEFDLTDVTAANAEEKITEFANRLVPALKMGDHPGRSPLDEAKRRMLEPAARDVLGKATAAVPVVIEQLTPEFDKHAAAYTTAVAALPDIVDSDSLVQTGPAAVTAYGAGRSPIVGPVGSRAGSYVQSISRSRTPRAGAGGCIRQRTRRGSCNPMLNDGAGDCGRP